MELGAGEGSRTGTVVGIAKAERLERCSDVAGTKGAVDAFVLRCDDKVERRGGDIVIWVLGTGDDSRRKG